MVMTISDAEIESATSAMLSRSEQLIQQWEYVPVQWKALALALLYIVLALFPWTCATAVFAFASGRQWGWDWGRMDGVAEGAAYIRPSCQDEHTEQHTEHQE